MAMAKFNIVLLLVFGVCLWGVSAREQFRVHYEWKTFNFTWLNDEDHVNAVSSRKYIPENIIISDIKTYKDRMYLTLPRLKDGVPATIVSVPMNSTDTSPRFKPFPSWSMNAVGVCNAFQSVQGIEIDKDGWMWILDNGRTSILNSSATNATICLPRLFKININDLSLETKNIIFPPTVANDKSYLSDLVLDDSGKGYVYITDNSKTDPGIIVFDIENNDSWKIRDAASMMASEEGKNFLVNGTEVSDIHINNNINGIALGPRFRTEKGIIDRNVYFSPLASKRLYSTMASSLKNKSNSNLPHTMVASLIIDQGKKASQTDGMIMDSQGVLFFGVIKNHSVVQWDSRYLFETSQLVLAKDNTYIQWPAKFGFDMSGNLYVVINRLLNFVTGKVNKDDVNYRILRSNVETNSYLFGQTEQDIEKYERELAAMTPPPQSPQSKQITNVNFRPKNQSSASSLVTPIIPILLSSMATLYFI